MASESQVNFHSNDLQIIPNAFLTTVFVWMWNFSFESICIPVMTNTKQLEYMPACLCNLIVWYGISPFFVPYL